MEAKADAPAGCRPAAHPATHPATEPGGGLKQRLDRLRQHSQVVEVGSAQDAAVQSGLAERLARLRPWAVQAQTELRRGDEQALADMLGAEILLPGVLRLRRVYSVASSPEWLRPALAGEQLPGHLEDLTELSEPPHAWCFLDTETSGLAGGTGTWVFLFGCAWFRNGTLEVEQVLLTRLDAETAWLQQVVVCLRQSRLLISYNGKSFDIPLLVTRARLATVQPTVGMRELILQLESLAHLDLLHAVRRAFAGRWMDCRLTTAEAELLRLRRDGDLPGAEAPAAWLAWLRHGEISRLAKVVEHNRQDLLSLAALVPALAHAHRTPHCFSANCAAVAFAWMARGRSERSLEVLQRAIHADAADHESRWLLAVLSRRRGDWDTAVMLWEELSQCRDPRALEALAKFHEHRRGDPVRALQYARLLPASPTRDHRCRRLQVKLGLNRTLAK